MSRCSLNARADTQGLTNVSQKEYRKQQQNTEWKWKYTWDAVTERMWDKNDVNETKKKGIGESYFVVFMRYAFMWVGWRSVRVWGHRGCVCVCEWMGKRFSYLNLLFSIEMIYYTICDVHREIVNVVAWLFSLCCGSRHAICTRNLVLTVSLGRI